MQQLFIRLFNLSLSASILILVIIVLRKVFRKAPKWIICLLWGMVAVRLLLPFTIESALSLAPRAEVVHMDAGDTRPVVESGIESVDNRINTYVGTLYAENTLPDALDSKVETNGTGNQPVNIVEILSMVWAVGVFLLLGYGIYSYLKVYRSVRLSVREEKNVYVCDDIKMPFILGILRPRIYLPSDLNASEKASILAHERAHIKRGDYLWKPLGYLLMTVYWFDPLIWLAYILLCRDIEMACDEKVVSNMSAEDKKQYSRVLLSFGTPDKMITICPLAFGEVGVKERVKGVLNYKKPAFWIILAAIMICILVVICFLTNAKDADDNATLPKLAEKQLETLYQQEFEKHSDKMPSSVIFEFMSLSYDGRIYTAGREGRGIYVSAEGVPGNAWEKSLADYPLEKICDVYGALFVKPVYGDLNADGQFADVYAWYDNDRKVKGECKEGVIWKLEGYAPEDQVILTIPQVNAFGRIEYEMITFRHMNDVKIETGRDLLNIVLKAQNVDQYGVIGQPDTLQTFTGDSLEDKYFIRDFVKAPVVSAEMITDIGTYQTIMIRERAPYDRFIE
ncbi:MAG: M56 family metallopeptidase [Acetatifactor sp.]|nr:M56 family metallopeptidase [Acetatifactor sp.]